MAAIAIPPVSEWNVKGDKNISCWLCQHFQRYDSREEPSGCQGECRKDSPHGQDGHMNELVTPSDGPVDGYFPYIPNGNVNWCNGFQPSLEENIPPSPGDSYDDCAYTDPVLWPRPDDERSSSMFIKWEMTESCWYCVHFQRRYEDPSSVTAESGCGGYCKHNPDAPYSYQEYGLPPGPPQPIIEARFRLSPRIGYAPLTWCSRWERATQAVPPVPTVGETPCLEPV